MSIEKSKSDILGDFQTLCLNKCFISTPFSPFWLLLAPLWSSFLVKIKFGIHGFLVLKDGLKRCFVQIFQEG